MLRRIAALAGVLTLALAASAQADVVRKDFLAFNACGAIHNDDNAYCNNWGNYQTDDDGVTDNVVEAIKASIDSPGGVLPDGSHFRKPDAVMLQEICFHQYDALRGLLPGYDSRFEATGWNISSTSTSNPNCKGTDKRHGLAVFTQAQIVDTSVWKFTQQATSSRSDDGYEDRKLLCVKVNWANPTRVCSTHLAVHDAFCSGVRCNNYQAHEVEEYVHDNYELYNTPVVIGGDFNAPEDEVTLSHLYASWINPEGSGHGNYKEVDQGEPACRCGEGTTPAGNKYDYIFLTQGKWAHLGGDATSSPWSDHDPLWGKAELAHTH